jgi:hypothetical protein
MPNKRQVLQKLNELKNFYGDIKVHRDIREGNWLSYNVKMHSVSVPAWVRNILSEEQIQATFDFNVEYQSENLPESLIQLGLSYTADYGFSGRSAGWLNIEFPINITESLDEIERILGSTGDRLDEGSLEDINYYMDGLIKYKNDFKIIDDNIPIMVKGFEKDLSSDEFWISEIENNYADELIDADWTKLPKELAEFVKGI